jgi:putative Holliday junction resolvase
MGIYMKILALDIGDVWTGTALSDALGMFAKPYQTTETKNLNAFLRDLFLKETIETIIIGHPRTMKGTSSDQTKKVEEAKGTLEKEFPAKKFIFWDERLSSKRADALKKATTKEEKIKSHSIAAAFILESYLQFARPTQEEE